MKLRFASATVGLAVGVTAASVIACAAGAYIYSTHHFESLLETARVTALAQGDLIRIALEHQMIENDRSLIGSMIESFGKQPRVEQVVLLDRYGAQRYSSTKTAPSEEFRLDSPTCQACHRYPPDQRGSSRVIETRGGTVLRTVVPIRNREACYRCHEPSHRINGILILDYNAGEIHAAMNKDLRWLVAVTAVLTLLLVSAIALVIRVAVLRRLQRFETTARIIAAGDLERRVPAEGSDTIAWLAREFNTMADSVTGLLGEVRHQRERLETVINSIDDGIVVLDPKRSVIAANESFLERAGQVRQDLLGRCCREVGRGVCNVTDCPTVACVASGARQVRICERHRPDGSVAWEEVHASPIVDPNGNLTYIVEVWRDISDRRAAEAHLAESHRLASVGLLASGFSHELNTPLATVLTCVEGILRTVPAEQNGPLDQKRIRESASIARDQVLRCRGITQHFLRMSRGQSSSGDVVDVHATVAAVGRLIEPTARAHSVKIDVTANSSGVLVRADEAELQNAIINLMLNAVQACDVGGTVTVSTEVSDATHIRVVDNGCGIQSENQARIFEPFFSMRKGGTGIGLFLTLNSVRRWGGDIRVDSTAGKGSSFDVVFPIIGKSARQGVNA
jgi:PAS domain S-box-containing protein